MARLTRAAYAATYGPTTGDMVRLGDTSLLAEVEHDSAVYGDECLTGAGKVMRDGLGFHAPTTAAAGGLDYGGPQRHHHRPGAGHCEGRHRH